MDERLRNLGRGEGFEAEAALLRARLRGGDLSEARLEAAAALGDLAAAAALGAAPGPASPALVLVAFGELGREGMLRLADGLLSLHGDPLEEAAAHARDVIRGRLRGDEEEDLAELFVAAMVPTLQGRSSTQVLSVLMAAAILDAERAGGAHQEAVEGYLAARRGEGSASERALESATRLLLPALEEGWPEQAPALRAHLEGWLLGADR